jgi:chaperonin GroES
VLTALWFACEPACGLFHSFICGSGQRLMADAALDNRGRFPRSPNRTKEMQAMATTSFTPLHDRILVRRIEEGESIRGGIIIPDSAKEKPQQGEVISVGKGKSNDEGKVFPLDVKAGDSILFGKYSGTEIKIDGEELLIMREEEVLGILKK